MGNIDLKGGKIIYNEMHIDFNKSFEEQIDNLTEDLLQIEYDDNYLLDIGWYPECKANGEIIVQVIKKNNWEQPIYKKSCKTIDGFKEVLLCAIEYITN